LSNKQSDFFEFGEIVKTRGLRGCLKIYCFTEAICNFTALKEVFLSASDEDKKCFHVRKNRASGKFLFVEFEEIADVETARKFIGCKVFLPKKYLPQLSEGEYYWCDIIGLKVFTEEGKPLGIIQSIFATGSNDIYVCKGRNKEILLPAIADVILKIDIPGGKMTVRLLKGL